MANMALVFDVLAKDNASGTFRNVGDSAERAGKQTTGFGTQMAGAMKVAAGALLGAGLIEGFKNLYQAADESRKIAALTEQVIKSTGGAAKVSAQQVGDLAAAIAKKTGVDDEAIQSGQNLLLTFTNVKNAAGAGNDIFNQTTQIMTDMSVALGTDASGSAIQLGKALNDPIKGVSALTRVGVSFTEQQKDQIRALVESGDILGAQKIILAELGKEFGGAAEAAATPLGKLQQRAGDLAEQIGGYLIPMVDKAATFFMDKLLPALQDLGGFVTGVGLPALQALGTVVGAVASAFNALPGPLQAGVVALGAFALLRGPVGDALETIGLKAMYMRDSIVNAGTGIGGFKAAGGGLLSFLGGPWGIAIAGATAGLGLLVGWLGKSSGASADAAAFQRDLAAALRESKGAIDGNVRATVAQAAADKEIGDSDLLAVAEKLGISLPRLTDALTGNKAAYDELAGAANAYIDQALLSENAGDLGFTENAENARLFLGALDELAPTMGRTVDENGRVAAATAETGAAMDGTTAQTEESAAALEAWLGQLQGIAEGFVQPLTTYQELLSAKAEAERASAEATAAATEDSTDSWEDYVDDVGVSLDEYATKLEEQLTAQDNWRTNIATITQRGGLEVGQAIADMGVEGVQLAAQLANGTDAEFQRMAALILEDTRRGGADWAAEMDTQMKVMAAIGAAGATATARSVADQLGLGLAEVAAIAAQYGITLANGVNPLLQSLGKGRVRIPGVNGVGGGVTWEADGGVLDFFANGGVREDHVAQIARAGSMRVWAEPETGGEAYIPLAASKRERSTSIWHETGKRLGIDFETFANGGFFSAADVPHPTSTGPYGIPISTAADATMQKGFDEVTAWLEANAGGVAGNGAVGGAWGSLWQLVKAAIPQARMNSTFRAGDPGYHGRGKAIDFGFGSGPGGAGSAGLASINRLLHDRFGGSLAELIYDGIGDDRPDLKNGKPLTYSASTRAQHANHVHAAVYDGGGLLPPGLTLAYNGTGQHETIRTAGQEAALRGPVELTGRLEFDRDGMLRLVDGRIVSALTSANDRGRYNS